MDSVAIENKARALLMSIYRHEQKTRPGVLAPMQMIEPELVADYLGYELAYVPTLGNWGTGASAFEIAGLLDQQRQIVRLSLRFPRHVGRFTAAHEIGHIVLEHPGTVIHRDRPVFHIEGWTKHVAEREADYFAACLLVPRGLLEQEYAKRFRIGPPLPLTDDIAFNLCGQSAHALMRAGPNSFQFASAVATARSFGGSHFRSLAETFNVSVSVMALRLRELRLIED